MLAFTFPGQGSQRPGMGLPWRNHESWELVDEASDIAGRDVGALLCDADADELKDTRNAQLTTFVSSLMVLDAVERLGIAPSYCAGHSLGEYTALTATGALGFDDGIRLVGERGAAMHDAGLAQPGTMAAVLGLDDDQVDVACRRADADVWVANFNAPGQVVIAGSPDGVEAATAHAKDLGAKKVMPLQVAGAFHTPFMTAARDRLRAALAEADPRDSDVPVVSNVDALPHVQAADWASLLSAQLSSPGAMEALAARARRCRRHRFRRVGPWRGSHRHGEAHRVGVPNDLGRHAGGSRQVARMGRRRTIFGPATARGRAPLRRRTTRGEPRRPASSPRSPN